MGDALVLMSEKALQAQGHGDPRKPLPIDRFASRSKQLRSVLEGGGDLYIVFVNWAGGATLTAVLESPEYDDGVWVSKSKNTMVQRADTAKVLPTLTLVSGEGLPTDDVNALKATLRHGVALTKDDTQRLWPRGDAPPTNSTFPPLRFANPREHATQAGMKAWEKHQLKIVGRTWDGRDLHIRERLKRSDETDAPYLHDLIVFALIGDDGFTHLDCWFHHGDSGAVFRHRTNELVAEVAQGAVETQDLGLLDALEAAAARAREAGMKRVAIR